VSVAIGSDHGGYDLKQHLAGWLEQRGCRLVDCGTHDGARCDYPVIAAAVARRVAAGECDRGVIIDGAGIGSAMMANRLPGVRAALCYDLSSARNAREHNDANVLTLGARLIGQGLAEQILDAFLTVRCTEERHLGRVAMIDALAGDIAAPCGGAGAGSGANSDGRGGLWGGGARPAVAIANFALAQGPADRDNAPAPARPERDASSAAFQASAARWLTMDKIDQLSGSDLERVAARLAELIGGGLLGGGQLGAGQWCFGNGRVDAAAARKWIDMGVGRLSNGLGGPVASDVASFIDHTLLKPNADRAQISSLCAEAREHRFASVCINPFWVPVAARLLRGSAVAVCTVVGFPLGATMPETKAAEARRAIRDGAREIDMVINIGALKSGDDELVFRDIRAVVDACEDGRALCKVIIETALLDDDEKVRACLAARRARADFVKTSTGFASGGATAADVALMSHVVRGARMGVKASGGVRNLTDFDAMVRAGATRIGASAGVKIVKEAEGS